MSYKYVLLQDICEKASSNITQKELIENEGTYPIYGASGFIKNVDFFQQEKEYIAIVKDGAGIGRAMKLPAKSSVIGTMQYIIPKDNINISYLYYAICSMHLEKYFSGATIPHIYFRDYKNEKLPLPPLEVQLKIAAIFENLEHLIENKNKQLISLDKLAKSRFIEMFGDPYYNPKGWKSDYLGNYMTTLTDFSANGSYEILDSNVVMYDEPNYAIMVRTTDLEKGDLTGELKYIDEKAYNLLSKSKLYGGELIMSKIGSAGKIYLMPFINKPASLGRNAFMFRFNECINIVFLYTLLNTDYGTNMIQQHVRGAVTKTITKESTRKLLIYVPPIELQNQFADFVAQVDKSKFTS